jgi:polyhydroxyalkanoate synthesis regulator phasin
MRFTIINMGKTDFTFSRGDEVITLLFFRIPPAQASWQDHNPQPRNVSQEEVDFLAKDFANIDERVRKASKQAVGESGYRYLFATIVLPAIVGAFFGWISYLVGVYFVFQPRVEATNNSAIKLEAATSALQDRMNRAEKTSDDFAALRAQARESTQRRISELADELKAAKSSNTDTLLKRIEELETRVKALSSQKPGVGAPAENPSSR